MNEAFTLSKGEAPILELNAAERGQIRVRGWDRADYSVETCKIAVAETRAAAEQVARGISVAHSAGRISYTGPATDSAEWTAVFIVHAPRDASLNLEAKNGPIEVRGVNGSVKLRAVERTDRDRRLRRQRGSRTRRTDRSRSRAIAAKCT